MKNKFISTTEAAQIMGISTVAVFKKIKSGEIKTERVGRNYLVYKDSLPGIYKDITKDEKTEVEKAVGKVVKEYGDALKKLGKE